MDDCGRRQADCQPNANYYSVTVHAASFIGKRGRCSTRMLIFIVTATPRKHRNENASLGSHQFHLCAVRDPKLVQESTRQVMFSFECCLSERALIFAFFTCSRYIESQLRCFPTLGEVLKARLVEIKGHALLTKHRDTILFYCGRAAAESESVVVTQNWDGPGTRRRASPRRDLDRWP